MSESENYVIHGLDYQARALAALQGDQDKPVFLAGTQSLKFSNQVCVLDYDEDSNQVTKRSYGHPLGEVWHISCCPAKRDLVATCYSSIINNNKCQPGCSLFSLDNVRDVGDGSSSGELVELCRMDRTSEINSVSCFYWQPLGNSRKALVAADSRLTVFDVDISSKSMRVLNEIDVENKSASKITTAKWNPHHNCNSIALSVDSTVKGFDIRSKDQTFAIDACHPPVVRNLDFNPNRQYYLVTCGDDCRIKFWDIRKPKEPVMSITDKHSHWIWSVKYNPVHDQLLLSCSSDARLILHGATSVSSEANDNDESSDNEDDKTAKLEDGTIKVYEEHEESVYCCEWSSADPWLFASLSYDGRVIVNKVPRSVKYKVLQL